jgi:hypothetical protein
LINGHTWYVQSFVNDQAEVAIPVLAIKGMSPKDIGEMVRWLVSLAVGLNADEILSDEGYYKNLSEKSARHYLSVYKDYEQIAPSAEVRKAREIFEAIVLRYDQQVSKEEESLEDYVYLAHCDTGHHKIGISNRPFDRIKHFDTIMPVSVTLVHYFQADSAIQAETLLHNAYRERRVSGEWFDLTCEEVEDIKNIDGFENGQFVQEGRA